MTSTNPLVTKPAPPSPVFNWGIMGTFIIVSISSNHFHPANKQQQQQHKKTICPRSVLEITSAFPEGMLSCLREFYRIRRETEVRQFVAQFIQFDRCDVIVDQRNFPRPARNTNEWKLPNEGRARASRDTNLCWVWLKNYQKRYFFVDFTVRWRCRNLWLDFGALVSGTAWLCWNLE